VHGGQSTPIHLFALLGNLYFAGYYEHTKGATHASNPQAMRVYVSRGTFQWGPIFRQLSQHEVTMLVMRAPEAR
jgi:predicted MPP superfamily phosphohydrolase